MTMTVPPLTNVSLEHLQEYFSIVTKQMGPSQRKMNKTYVAWRQAVNEWEILVRDRDEIWSAILDKIGTPTETRQSRQRGGH
jgi:hypothetical protein